MHIMGYLPNQVLLPIYSCSYSMAGLVVHLAFGVQDGDVLAGYCLRLRMDEQKIIISTFLQAISTSVTASTYLIYTPRPSLFSLWRI
jgi:hypothetical protein